MLEATERNVRLVVVGGRPAYGSTALLRAAGATDVEAITVAGVPLPAQATVTGAVLPGRVGPSTRSSLVREPLTSWLPPTVTVTVPSSLRRPTAPMLSPSWRTSWSRWSARARSS